MPLIPFVVPPIYEKSSQYQAAMAPVWTQAEQVLSSTDRLIIFGYSFPDADFAARRLLRRAFHANSKVNEAVVIDPSGAAAKRVGELLVNATTVHHKSVPAYVKYDSHN